MRNRFGKYVVSLLCLLVFLLTGQAGVQGYVWCLGIDGHAALEHASGNDCAPTSALPGHDDHHDDPSSHLTGADHCGPCLDLPATFEAAQSRYRDPERAVPLAAITAEPLPAFSFVPVLFSSAKLYPQPPPRPSQAIAIHRTVVLLN